MRGRDRSMPGRSVANAETPAEVGGGGNRQGQCDSVRPAELTAGSNGVVDSTIVISKALTRCSLADQAAHRSGGAVARSAAAMVEC